MPVSGAAAARALRDVVARIDVAALTARLEADLRDEPAYQRFVRDQDLDDRGPTVIRWNLELFGRWLADGQPPSPEELGRIASLVRVRAEEGMPIEEGLRVYRRGARLGWESVLRIAEPDERQALLEGSGVYLDYVDLVADAFVAAYAAAERMRDPDEARARELLERLRRAAPGAHERAAADAIGLDLDAPTIPFVATTPGATADEHATMAAKLRAGGALAAVVAGAVVGLASASAIPTASDGALEEVVARTIAGDPRALVAVSDPVPWPQLDATLDELAVVAGLGVARGHRGEIRADDVLLDLLLAQAPRTAERIATRVLGDLDPEQVATLRALVEQDFDRSAAARALPVHRNTLLERIRRIEAETRLDLRRSHDQALVALAVRRRAGR